jgi:hypothetical protein
MEIYNKNNNNFKIQELLNNILKTQLIHKFKIKIK